MRTSNTFADITADKPELGPHGMGYVTNGSKPRRAFWSIVLSIGFIGTVTVRDLKIFEAFWTAKLHGRSILVTSLAQKSESQKGCECKTALICISLRIR